MWECVKESETGGEWAGGKEGGGETSREGFVCSLHTVRQIKDDQ